ncbi:MAG: hypothetical protein ACOYXT_06405 [Bacteroidota bacterium]
MKKTIFKWLVQFNKFILPRYSKKDITRLGKFEKLVVAYRYWVTKNSL